MMHLEELASDRSSFIDCQKSVGPVYITSTLDECSNEVALTLEPSVPCLSLQAREKRENYDIGMKTVEIKLVQKFENT